VAAAAAQLPKKTSVSTEEWVALNKKERKAIANYRDEVTLLIGDSNTQAPYEIFARSSTGPMILNEAVSGTTTAQILARLKEYPRMENKGRAILSGGTNDLKAVYDPAGTPTNNQVNRAINDIIANKAASIDAIKASNPNATLVLASVLPADTARIPGSVIANVNRQIKKLAQDKGVEFIDVTSALADERGKVLSQYTTDGIHFNGPGYFLIGQKLGIIPTP
jgi:lysophospholipase L1-like esterase